ncbi:MAG: alpha/beta hydrolase [Proteobacteria bacterium]|nr:alpha/beta hydrolase [Desulfobulbaceae bacterium]MBU4153424.1 alpha/beta hydrolase [Pseudomonadota bacterium]
MPSKNQWQAQKSTHARNTLLMVIVMLLSGCNLQHSLLYFPSSTLPAEESLTAAHLKPWPSPSLSEYRALVSTRETASQKGTIIIFHGNGGTAIDRTFYMETLAPLGYRVILAEYPRYGGRKGELGEKAFVTDAMETTQLAFEQFGEPIFLLGESLGCGVAAATANHSPIPIEGIILITPWDTLRAITQAKFPFLPVRIFLTDSYDTIANLKSFPGRVAVVAAGQDTIIPIQHADHLYRSITTSAKKMWQIQAAGHNDLLFHTNQAWWRVIMDFVTGADH